MRVVPYKSDDSVFAARIKSVESAIKNHLFLVVDKDAL